LGRPVVGPHLRRVLRIARNLASDVPELLQVRISGILGGFDAERGVTARSAGTGLVILLLGFRRQGEELLKHPVSRIDDGLGDAVAADSAKTEFTIGRAEFGHKRLAIMFKAPDVQRGYVLHRLVQGSCRFVGYSQYPMASRAVGVA